MKKKTPEKVKWGDKIIPLPANYKKRTQEGIEVYAREVRKKTKWMIVSITFSTIGLIVSIILLYLVISKSQ